MNAVQRHPGADEDRRQTLTDDPPKLPLVWLCVGAVVVVLVVAFALLWFAQPMADDFARGYEGLPRSFRPFCMSTGPGPDAGLR